MRKLMSWIYEMFRPCEHNWRREAYLTDGDHPVEVQMCGKCWRVRFIKW